MSDMDDVVLPTFNCLYRQDDTQNVLCGKCLDEAFERWPDDWSEIAAGIREEYACDSCGRG